MIKYELGSGNNRSFTRLNKRKYGKCSKILSRFTFFSQIKCWISGLEFIKCLSE